MTEELVVSGPFNVQHIAKIKNVGQIHESRSVFDNSLTRNSTDYNSLDPNGSTPKSATTAVSSSIVVCVHPFTAEYENELSCSPGDIFKMVDGNCVNGWILTMSISTGSKGWIPRDNVKILDLHNSTPTESEIPVLSNSRNSNTPSKSRISKSISHSTINSSTSSVLDYYSTGIAKSESVYTTDTVCSSLPYATIFANSMNSPEFSTTSFWYRIDLTSRIHNNQQIHIARYYSEIFELNKRLQNHIKHSNINIKLPTLPRSLGLNSMDVLSSNLSNISNYLRELFYIIDSQQPSSLLVKMFVDFCTPTGNDFQHYVDLTDDQILNILRPTSSNRDSNIELEFGNGFQKPFKTFCDDMTINSRTSSISKNSSENGSLMKSDNVKVKLMYKDDFIMIRLASSEISYHALKSNISKKLKIEGFTLAYRNEQNIFVLLRDDNGFEKALRINPKRMVVKVI